MSSSNSPSRPGATACSVPEAVPPDNSLLPESHQPHRWQTVAVCIFLAAIVWAVFGQTLRFDFINYDDPTYVYKNPHLNHGLDWNEVAWVFTHENLHEWVPVTYVSRMVDSQIYGLNAGGHHLTNVLLHAVTAILLFLLLKRMTGALWRAAFVASVFAIHPLRVESVAWVVERKDVLSGLFFMLTLWAWLDYVDKRSAFGNRQNAGPGAAVRDWLPAYLLSLVFFTMGLLSKPMLVTMPLLFLLLDYWPLKRIPADGLSSVRSGLGAWRGLILEKVPFVPLSVAACVATMLTQKNVVITAQHTALFWRIGNVLLAYTDYLKHLVYPVGLALVYPFSTANPPVLIIAACALLLAAITAVAVVFRRGHPYLMVGWLWYIGMFLPIIDSMQATQNSRADRYSYLPHIGLYIMIAWGATELLKRWRYRQIVLAGAAAVVLAALSADAYIQTGYWKNSVTVWTHSLACTSENFFAENTLGSALADEGKYDAALLHFERSIKFNPNYAESRANYGITFANLGRRDEAVEQLKLALQLNPHFALASYNLGVVLANEGNTSEAIPYLTRALQLDPNNMKAHYDLGVALATMGKWDDAILQYDLGLGRKLELTDAQYITGVAFSAKGKWEDARVLFERVAQTRPDSAEAYYRLGNVLKNEGQSVEAAQHFQKALELATAQGDTSLAEVARAEFNTNSTASQPSTKP